MLFRGNILRSLSEDEKLQYKGYYIAYRLPENNSQIYLLWKDLVNTSMMKYTKSSLVNTLEMLFGVFK